MFDAFASRKVSSAIQSAVDTSNGGYSKFIGQSISRNWLFLWKLKIIRKKDIHAKILKTSGMSNF